MGYTTRPGPSPALAALVVAGAITPRESVLDVGCGKGRDAVALARWGFHHVTGVDDNARELAAARAYARRAGASVGFVKGDALDLPAVVGDHRFDVALDTLFTNNLSDEDVARFATGLAKVLSPGGRVVVCYRVRANVPDDDPLPPGYERRFRFGRALRTQLPEERQGRAARDWAQVLVAVGVLR